MTQPDLARAPARAPRDLSGSSASSRSMTPTAFAVKATAGKLPPGEDGASPCSAGLAAKPLHHAAATFTPPLVRARWPRHSTTRAGAGRPGAGTVLLCHRPSSGTLLFLFYLSVRMVCKV